ncbi:heat shock protein HtpX [Halogranum gelatinilyticum]|uniref:Heat shock protein HtpX n=1 Tax=Halogranum gelatinilyticum TaxID=660521 RepID=A0A1G9P4G5_9EURY|nr:M48 family metalloprotease [Halogranum gelatinilyticum]SDL93604.1 heat shock protein HtpX [Halogranum gelatinilyticum]
MHWSRDVRLVATTVGCGVLVLAGYVAFAALLVGWLRWFGVFVGLGFGCLLFAFLVAGPPLTLRGVDANVLSAEDAPQLLAAVQRLAQQGGVTDPDVAVVDTAEPNAFTVGWGRGATLCVTTGLLATLDRDELEAVLAHELAHATNYDAAVLTVASLPTLLGLSTVETSRDVASEGVQAVFLALLFGVLSAVLVVATAPVVVALSRAREYAADRGAVALTGDPAALASALRTLAQAAKNDEANGPPTTDARELGLVSAFCVVEPVTAPLPWLHPSTERRVARLRDLERSVETT